MRLCVSGSAAMAVVALVHASQQEGATCDGVMAGPWAHIRV